jgi:predicted CXXCH cytochrome family protein
LKAKKTVHPPAKKSCIQCHNPHGSANKAMLTDAVPGVCSSCHPNETTLAQRAISKHGPMNDAKSCMNCHDPHVSDQPRLLTAVQVDLCLGCHDKVLTTAQGTIKNMKDFLTSSKDFHGPVKSGNCVACHNPHGSDYKRILVKSYPSEFYTSYAEGKYALCFSCHDKAAFDDVTTTNKTNFRDGSRNLHFLHVNKNEKGRTCSACHGVHATAGTPAHMLETIEFGGWKMPLDFTKNAKGGTCAPGCHGEKRYAP